MLSDYLQYSHAQITCIFVAQLTKPASIQHTHTPITPTLPREEEIDDEDDKKTAT
jgi:hypothetical protein